MFGFFFTDYTDGRDGCLPDDVDPSEQIKYGKGTTHDSDEESTADSLTGIYIDWESYNT